MPRLGDIANKPLRTFMVTLVSVTDTKQVPVFSENAEAAVRAAFPNWTFCWESSITAQELTEVK